MVTLLNRFLRLLRPAQTEPTHPFDLAHGVDTSGLFYADRLPSGHPHDRYSEGYYATAPSLLHGALALWQGTLPAEFALSDYTLIDLGCGKGRVVLLASLYPFRAVRGIELNGWLTRTAQRNIRRWLRSGATHAESHIACRDLAVKRGDVLDVELPDGPVVLFLFNSFGAEVLRPLLERLAALRGPGEPPLDLIYLHPDHSTRVTQVPEFALLRYAEIPLSQEDTLADAFEVGSDFCSVYRLSGDDFYTKV